LLMLWVNTHLQIRCAWINMKQQPCMTRIELVTLLIFVLGFNHRRILLGTKPGHGPVFQKSKSKLVRYFAPFIIKFFNFQLY
jgi:hypothetical protein